MAESLIEKITRLHREDQQSGRLAVALDDVPIHYESMTPQWLTAILCTDVPGAEVIGFTLGPRDDGTSGRRRIEIVHNAIGAAAGLPPSLFGKSSQSLSQRISYALNRSLHAETNFYNVIRPRVDIECPRAYHARSCEESCNSIVLLEDMTGYADFCDENTVITRADAEEMMVLLANLHAPFCDPESYASILPSFDTYLDRWTGIVNDNGLAEYSNQGFLAAQDVIPARLFARFDEVWPRTMQAIAEASKLPHTYTHGDTHLSNWFRTRTGRLGLSDWQGCALDHWARDVAYALACTLQPEDRRAWGRDLLRIYLEKMEANGVSGIAFDDAWLWLRRQTLTALAYWTVTYTPSPGMPEDMQPKFRTREYIRRIASAVDDMDALDAFS